MNRQLTVRFILGVLFVALGYSLVTRFLILENPQLQTGLTLVTALLFGAAGVFLVPTVSEWLRHTTSSFAQRVAREVIAQLHLPRFPVGRGNSKPKAKSEYLNPIIVDTSALIDGRIADVVDTGFLHGTLVIPRFILSELQHIADASDALRRGRGRRGLEILGTLKKSKLVKTVIYSGDSLEEKKIDDKLVRLAKNLKAKILTTDFNLNKVATVSGVKTLNINELVNALKTTLLPGEPLEVKVIQEGKEKTQGVGYLPDGTMIVVEGGADYIGRTVSTIVSRVLQTAAGRMIFVQLPETAQKRGDER